MSLNETCNKVRNICLIHFLSLRFETSKCLFTIDFQRCFTIRRQEGPRNKGGSELNGTHQLVIYAHDVSLSDENINIINRNTEALLDAWKKKLYRSKGRRNYVCVHVL